MMSVRRNIDFHYLAAVLLLSCALVYFSFIGQPKKIYLLRLLDEIPLSMGIWEGDASTLDRNTLKNAGVDQYIMRTYYAQNQEPISVYVGFYSYQEIGHTIHSPLHCYPGSGWNPVSDGEKIISADRVPAGKLAVNKLLIEKGKDKQVVYYWYQSRGRIITNEYWEKFYLILDTMMLGRNDGSLVRISTLITVSEQEAETHLQSFINHFYPHLALCLPQ